MYRTEYLLKLEGAEIGEEFAAANGKDRQISENGPSRVPADLLEEVFDLNMQLEEMRMARKMGEEDPELQASLSAAKGKFIGLLEDVDRDMRSAVAGVGCGRLNRAPGRAKNDGGPA